MGDPPWAVEARGMGTGVHVGELLAILECPGAGRVAVPILSAHQGHMRVWTRLWPGTRCCGSPLGHRHVGTRDTPGFWWGDGQGCWRASYRVWDRARSHPRVNVLGLGTPSSGELALGT